MNLTWLRKRFPIRYSPQLVIALAASFYLSIFAGIYLWEWYNKARIGMTLEQVESRYGKGSACGRPCKMKADGSFEPELAGESFRLYDGNCALIWVGYRDGRVVDLDEQRLDN